MIASEKQLLISLQQLQRVMNALDSLRNEVLLKDPKLFGVLVEAPLDDIQRLRNEIDTYLEAKLTPAEVN
jgi:hypothetical protein